MNTRRKSSCSRQCREKNDPIGPCSTLAIACGTSCIGPWGIERLLEVEYRSWPHRSTLWEVFALCLYVARDTVHCQSCDDASRHEPSFSTDMIPSQVWIE